jgi:hypothetical protein
MAFRGAVLLALALLAPTLAAAQQQQMDRGTPEEQAACRPDVRRFCSKVKADADPVEFLKCLENNRDALSKKCLAVLIDHGR